MIKFTSAVLIAAVAAAALGSSAVAQVPAGNAANGAKVFKECTVCHSAEKGINRVGPSLHGVVGRKAGIVPGFEYSAANLRSRATWDEAYLFKYLEAPPTFMPGTKMQFPGLKNPQERADVIAFLKTKS
jgi:cytochrome c